MASIGAAGPKRSTTTPTEAAGASVLPATFRVASLDASFAVEYGLWLVALFPFLLPWAAWHAARGTLVEALFPASWEADFVARLAATGGLWLSSYGLAFCVYRGARLFAWGRAAKYDPRVPGWRFVAGEALRSAGGIAVLAAMQVAVAARARGAAGAAAVPPGPRLAAGAAVVALWADFHFYATHRLLHTPALFRAIHKTHHRSHNVDPFSGLSMHPLEHLLYFSALLLPGAPLWVTNLISIAMVVNPIPAHLGYGPLDRHHWDHHTRFNWNFGSSMLWDVLLGTAAPKRGASLSAAAAARAAEARNQRALCVGGADDLMVKDS